MQIYGFHAVMARLRQAPGSFKSLYVERTRDDSRVRDLLKLAAQQGVQVVRAEPGRLDRMAGGRRHQGVVAQVETRQLNMDLPALLDQLHDGGRPPFLLLLDGVTDPRNLGACLRAADGAGVDAVIAPKDHAAPLTDIAMHTASGAGESVPYILVTNLVRTIEKLQDEGFIVYGLADEASAPLYQTAFSGPIAIVMGAEDKGMRRLVREQCDALISIPMQGDVSSLNVSVATGVVLYEVVRQRLATAAAPALPG
ncbi:MAG: 23S rRNA (guanosine(2251)-2'-O)-methyltransferase RlmB [Lautropia sp.]|nr:23S rRNA (guanosine(2251)-2'-O)-methyltransferase RlmB [Lautropia sp.]